MSQRYRTYYVPTPEEDKIGINPRTYERWTNYAAAEERALDEFKTELMAGDSVLIRVTLVSYEDGTESDSVIFRVRGELHADASIEEE